jgi:predicted nucleotidyltransferase
MRIALAFHKLANAVQPTPAGVNKAKLRLGSIKSRLSNSFFVSKALLMGSTARDTAIHGASDVDFLVVFRRDEARWGDRLVRSNTFIQRIRDDLDARFPATTVRRDGQSIVVQFGQGAEPVDVVPAIFHEFRGATRSPVYLIPNGLGDWMETAPEAHNSYLRKVNEATSGKLRRAIQMLKHWRNSRTPSIPLASIHLELLLAASQICVGPKSYSRCLRDTFHLLRQRECRGLRDPLGVAGVLYAVQTEAQHGQLVSAVDYAADHSQRAIDAEGRKDWSEAMRQWGIVFNGAFPH